MKCLAKWGLTLSMLIIVGPTSAYPQNADDVSFRQWVEFRNGEISATFNQIPVEVAVLAIHEKTGFQIVVPPEASGRTLNLSFRGLSLESAMRSLISSIGFRSFALMYDRRGQPLRAIVLEAQPDRAEFSDSRENVDIEIPPLTAEESDELNQTLTLWNDLKYEARGRIEDRLRSLPPSDNREELLKQYARQILGIKN
ncbi:MAG: hypothetical protein OEN50_03695 [Deltaproteobacteria bacterium]|nr:hypothetical protein [Deltaproteobacteria bacterium]